RGQPLAAADVEVLPHPDAYHFRKPAAVSVRTDGRGIARFSWPAGINQVRVIAPGVGYGTTGTFELREGAVARPWLPRLMPFGTIEGTVPDEVLKTGTYFKLPAVRDGGERKVSCDVKGGFLIEDVTPGTYWLRPLAGEMPLPVRAHV